MHIHIYMPYIYICIDKDIYTYTCTFHTYVSESIDVYGTEYLLIYSKVNCTVAEYMHMRETEYMLIYSKVISKDAEYMHIHETQYILVYSRV